MRRRQYRALTAEHRAPRTARYARNGERRTWFERLPVAWRAAWHIVGASVGFAGGYLAMTTIQAAILG